MTRTDDKRLHRALADIRTLADEMAQRSSFHVTFEDFRVMPADEIRDWQDIVRAESGDSAYKLPGELADLYAVTGGFDFRWKCDGDTGPIEGAIVLASLPELYQRDDEAGTAMKQCMASWRRFDNISPETYGAIRLDGGQAGLKCVYIAHDRPIRMNITPRDYVIAAVDHMGILGWQTGDTAKQEKIVRDLAALD